MARRFFDLFEILDHAQVRMPDARLTLFTNASRLTETLIKEFKRRKIALATSLQGLVTYGAMTGTKRKFNRLLSILAKASEFHWPMSVSMTITKANAHEVRMPRATRVLSFAVGRPETQTVSRGQGFRCRRSEWSIPELSARGRNEGYAKRRLTGARSPRDRLSARSRLLLDILQDEPGEGEAEDRRGVGHRAVDTFHRVMSCSLATLS